MIERWLEQRREGEEQSEADIRGFVVGVLDGTVTRAQTAAWLAFVYCKGMSDRETVSLTRAMTDSGVTLRWDGLDGPFVDKHSTGGVGDKVSLVLAPVWAAMGLKVPMISGRGLGITGGTLDKLESIPGFRTDLEIPALRAALVSAGCFISGQTGELAPADRVLYGLRNETGTVPSIPLITASILSKKMAEGIERLVLDVKCGSGAFMTTQTQARGLADSLVRVGNLYGVDTSAHITDMSQPLGRAVGNSLEVAEAVATLQGRGPRMLVDLVAKLSGEPERTREILASGQAYPWWERMVRAQGGDPDATLHGAGCAVDTVSSPQDGVVARCDAQGVGRAAFLLGAGRRNEGEAVHPGVGVEVLAHRGDQVTRGQPLFRVHHAERGRDAALAELSQAVGFEGA